MTANTNGNTITYLEDRIRALEGELETIQDSADNTQRELNQLAETLTQAIVNLAAARSRSARMSAVLWRMIDHLRAKSRWLGAFNTAWLNDAIAVASPPANIEPSHE